MADVVERLKQPRHREPLMKRWDEWRRLHKEGFGGSATRDEFESIIDDIDEERAEAAREIETLRARLSQAGAGGVREAVETALRRFGGIAVLARKPNAIGFIAEVAAREVAALSSPATPEPVSAPANGEVVAPSIGEIKEMIAYLRCADDDLAAKGEKFIGTRFSSVRDVVRDAIATFERIALSNPHGEAVPNG